MYDMKALYEATSVENAIELRLEHPEAQIIAGGTDVLVQMREGKRAGKELISIQALDEIRGICLDERFDAVAATEATRFRTDDACRHGGGQSVGIADGQHPFAQFQSLRTAHLDGGEVFGFHFNQGEVGRLVQSDNARLELAVVVEVHKQFVRTFDHMVVRDDISIGRQDDARACASALGRFHATLLTTAIALAKEIAEEILKGVVVIDHLRFAVDRHLDVNDRIDSLLGSIGEVNATSCVLGSSRRIAATESQGKSQDS